MKNTIQFHSGTPATEVLRLSKDGIWANPDIPADDAAKLVLEAIDHNIKILVQKAVLDERESCAKVCDEQVERSLAAVEKTKRTTDHRIYRAAAQTATWNAAAIRARRYT